MLENARFGIDFVPRHAEHVGEQTLRQSVAAYDSDRDLETLSRQFDVTAHFVFHVSVVDELLEHPGNRRRRDSELGG